MEEQKYEAIFDDDVLNIRQSVISFANIIKQDKYMDKSTSKVYSISGSYGVGKTFFCDKLYEVLKHDKIKTTKLNIWELDFYENPFIPILVKLNELYKDSGKSLPSKTLDFIVNSSNMIWKLMFTLCAPTNLVKSVSIPLASNVNISKILENLKSSNTIYEEFNSFQQALSELKTDLTEWAKKENNPIIIIIDELDRCKPDYAIKTLEILKHFFDIPGFVFILALDENQLHNSVKCIFGVTNFDGYKRKFINNSFWLPAPDKKSFTDYLYKKSGINEQLNLFKQENRELIFYVDMYNAFYTANAYSEFGNTSKSEVSRIYNKKQTSELIIKSYFAAYSEWFGFTLRQMEQVFDRLVLFIKNLYVSKELLSPDLAVLLVCLHEFDIGMYNILAKNKGIEGSILEKIYSDIAHIIYGNSAHNKFTSASINRDIVPKTVLCYTYSGYVQATKPKQIIYDNVDRFFNTDKRWIQESEAIDTKGVLSNITFDLEKFKKNYFTNMDFISHFD